MLVMPIIQRHHGYKDEYLTCSFILFVAYVTCHFFKYKSDNFSENIAEFWGGNWLIKEIEQIFTV